MQSVFPSEENVMFTNEYFSLMTQDFKTRPTKLRISRAVHSKVLDLIPLNHQEQNATIDGNIGSHLEYVREWI